MDLKFYLNKFAKLDNIEQYSFKTVLAMRDMYRNYLDESEGYDPDFPLSSFNSKGKKLNLGRNVYSQFASEDDIPEDFGGIMGDRITLNNTPPEISQTPEEHRKRVQRSRKTKNKK